MVRTGQRSQVCELRAGEVWKPEPGTHSDILQAETTSHTRFSFLVEPLAGSRRAQSFYFQTDLLNYPPEAVSPRCATIWFLCFVMWTGGELRIKS